MPIPLTMPRLSDTMETGTVIKWNVKPGDKVSAGDVIADVETDKATMELSAFDDGTVAKIVVPEGQAVPVGTLIAVLASEGEDLKDVAAAAGRAQPTPKSQVAAPSAAPAAQPDVRTWPARETPPSIEHDAEDRGSLAPAGEARVRVSPVARILAEEHGIDLRSIEGTGPAGRIIKRDVLKAMESARETAASVPPSAVARPALRPTSPTSPEAVPVTRVPMLASAPSPVGVPGGLQSRSIQLSGIRQTIARRLVEAKTTIPHYQVTVTFNMDPLLDMRSKLNEQLQPQGVKLSINDFLVRACALAMYRHPEFNASWAGDHIEVHGEVNIGFAISLPAERGGGLVVGVIRHADQKSLRVISFQSKALADKARTRGLSLEDMSDSTFTISNLGMFGVDNFTAIINPPNSAILAVGAAIEKPVVRDHQLTIGHDMNATLSCDHRVIDGAMAAEYLQTLRQLIENPATLLV